MTRKTMTAFDADRSAELSLVFKDSTTTVPLGQVQSFSWTNSLETTDTYRVGDSTKYRDYIGEDVTWEMGLYEDNDFSEVNAFFNNGLSTTDSTMTLIIESYNGEATNSTRVYSETLAAARVTNVTRSLEANSTNIWQFSGTATGVTGSTVTG